MVEVLIVKLPEGTKAALKKFSREDGFMGLSDLVRDLLRKYLMEKKGSAQSKQSDSTEFNSKTV